MATFDIILVAIVLVSAVIGLRRGLVKETLSLASWIGSFFAGLYFSPLLTALVADSVGDGAIVKTVTFFIAQGVALLLAIALLPLARVLRPLTGKDRTYFIGSLGAIRWLQRLSRTGGPCLGGFTRHPSRPEG